MKITYNSPNYSHHYPYAEAMNKLGVLNFFISGVSRFNKKSNKNNLKEKLKRHDFYQNIFIASRMLSWDKSIQSFLATNSQKAIDKASFKYSKKSDFFIYYRGCGINTTKRLKKLGFNTISILEEVNTHIEFQEEILNEEASRLGIPINKKTSKFKRQIESYYSADFILCPSTFVAKSFINKGFDPDKLIINNFGREILNKDITIETNENEFKLLYVGQIHYRKGLRYAIEAFKKMSYLRKKFYLVGPITGPSGIDLKKLPKNIIYLGVLKGKELQNIYKQCSAFVLPSLEEGLALVQSEALNASLPLITTENSGGEDLITHGKEGYIVPPGDEEKLLNCFEKLSFNIQLRRKMRYAAHQNSLRNNNWEKSVENLILKLNQIKNKK